MDWIGRLLARLETRLAYSLGRMEGGVIFGWGAVALAGVDTDEEARRLRFPSTPTIRVDGRDPFPGPERGEGHFWDTVGPPHRGHGLGY
ncbi:MAG: hypothetical protein M3R38_14745 [Actinomycetota bacterium]|nr:hypothetical protein [Actinomycetota bacterium]